MGRDLSNRRVFFLARSLNCGGAERQLVLLAAGLAQRGHLVVVAVFYDGGAFAAELEAAGVRLIVLEKIGRWDVLLFLIRLARSLRKEHPAILHSYLTVPNVLSALLKPLLPGTQIIWGLRASNMDLSRYDWLSRLTNLLECKLSRFADCIIANSCAGKRHAVENGFSEDKIVVIPNGIDTKYFRFDLEGRRQVRAAWGLGGDEILIGLAARLDPMKDHLTFLEAASCIARERQDVRFVCVGDGPAAYIEALKQQAEALGLNNRLIWAGARDDMPAVYSALDIACSSSCFGEGFSNMIAEAMACGVPCIVTEVGDSAFIVGDAGRVVTPGDHSALAAAIERLIKLLPEERRVLGDACRARVVSEFGIDRLVNRTEQTLGLV